jgi:hypothetical protein
MCLLQWGVWSDGPDANDEVVNGEAVALATD